MAKRAGPLDEYSRKRSFDKTPEPAPLEAPPKSDSGNFFCVQRHDATRLHYDFRLEIDGTLKSWAVPKGPNLQPLAKQLAMHVEDHPLDYGNFEGNIPKGEYGGGSVMLWDRGTFDLLGEGPGEDQIKRGDLKFRLHGEKLQGEFALVLMRGRGKGNEWLIIKKKDEFAQPEWKIEDHAYSVLTGRTQQQIAENLPAKKKLKKASSPVDIAGAVAAAMPKSIEPMLASLVDQPPPGDDWLYEVKWDGVRALCFVEGGKLSIFSRTGKRCDAQYPELSVLPNFVKAETAVLDGEIAVLDDQGRSSFSMIQPRIGVGDPNSVAHLARSTPVTLFLFDLLYLNGYDVRGAAMEDRRRLLEEIVKPTERIRISGQFETDGNVMLEAARERGLEGILAKRRGSKYEGRRSHSWLKLKVTSQQEFVIAGFTQGERSYFGALVLGLYQNGKLIHTGQVGTGFNDKSLKDLHARLEPLVTEKSPLQGKSKAPKGVTWVKPELVAQVKYLEFTPEGLLRAPVFLGLRSDKDPRDCVREQAEEVTEAVRESTPKPTGPLVTKNSPNELVIQMDGHSLKFTNLHKVFYPAEKITKGDLINYYDSIADLILPHLRDRPLSLKRYPNGINESFFFQKHAENKFADWIHIEPIYSEERKADIEWVICNDRSTLLYLTNLACIDQNPWMSRIGSLEHPDFALIDLDPTEGCPYDRIVQAAQIVRSKLQLLGLDGYPKTTGGDGMHIYVPLQPVYTYEQVRTFAELLSVLVIQEDEDLFTTPRAVSKRKKERVYFDYLQIASSKTISAPYVVRAYAGAPVATPLDWKEVKKGLLPGDFTLLNAPKRFAKVGDLFAPVLENLQRIEPALEKIGRLG